jgi:Fic family protein
LFNAERNLDKSLQNAFEYISPNFILIGQGERKAFEARLEPFVRIENIHNSTAIEGNTLTRQQVIDVLNGKPVSSARGIQNNEEVLGLAAATDFLLSTMQKQQKFTFTLEVTIHIQQYSSNNNVT